MRHFAQRGADRRRNPRDADDATRFRFPHKKIGKLRQHRRADRRRIHRQINRDRDRLRRRRKHHNRSRDRPAQIKRGLHRRHQRRGGDCATGGYKGHPNRASAGPIRINPNLFHTRHGQRPGHIISRSATGRRCLDALQQPRAQRRITFRIGARRQPASGHHGAGLNARHGCHQLQRHTRHAVARSPRHARDKIARTRAAAANGHISSQQITRIITAPEFRIRWHHSTSRAREGHRAKRRGRGNPCQAPDRRMPRQHFIFRRVRQNLQRRPFDMPMQFVRRDGDGPHQNFFHGTPQPRIRARQGHRNFGGHAVPDFRWRRAGKGHGQSLMVYWLVSMPLAVAMLTARPSTPRATQTAVTETLVASPASTSQAKASFA